MLSLFVLDAGAGASLSGEGGVSGKASGWKADILLT